MTWPEVTRIKIPRYTFFKYWCPKAILNVSYRSLDNCGSGSILNFFGGRVIWPGLVTWYDLRLKYSGYARKGCGNRHAKNGGRHRFSAIHEKPWGGRLDASPGRNGLKIITNGDRRALKWREDSRSGLKIQMEKYLSPCLAKNTVEKWLNRIFCLFSTVFWPKRGQIFFFFD